jgi:hypothetical protein
VPRERQDDYAARTREEGQFGRERFGHPRYLTPTEGEEDGYLLVPTIGADIDTAAPNTQFHENPFEGKCQFERWTRMWGI